MLNRCTHCGNKYKLSYWVLYSNVTNKDIPIFRCEGSATHIQLSEIMAFASTRIAFSTSNYCDLKRALMED